MIERLMETNDLKKLDEDKRIRDKFLEVTNSEQYLEILDDKQILLGCRPQNGTEVLQIDDAHIAELFRLLRDNYNLWQEITKIRKTAHKQVAKKFQESIFHKILHQKLDKNTLLDSAKLSKKIHAMDSKLKLFHDRLQGVFIIEGRKKEIVSSTDTFSSLIACKLNPTAEKYDLSWAKEIKYAKVLVIAPENKLLHKALKNYEFDRLQIGRKKSKNIWVKNHK